MAELREHEEGSRAHQTNDPGGLASHEWRDAYARLGLEQGAPMRAIEAAYWRFAHELKGQRALTPYTEAYEALVNKAKPRSAEAESVPASPTEPGRKNKPSSTGPGSKFGWPAS